MTHQQILEPSTHSQAVPPSTTWAGSPAATGVPSAGSAGTTDPVPASQSAEPSVPQVVLLVEDDALIRMDAADMLAEAGYAVIESEYGPDALAILNQQAVDVLVTDVGLPGMSGLELAEHARRLHPAIGVVFATGDTELPSVGRGPDAAVFLCKPYDGPALACSVRKAIERS